MTDLLIPGFYLVHFVAACVALSAALFATLSGLGILLFTRPSKTSRLIHPLHVLIAISLIVLWITGLSLAAVKFTPDTIPLKVVIKLLLITVLTVNSFMIGKHAARGAARWPRPALFHMSLRESAGLILCTSLSLACWTVAFVLAVHDGIAAATAYEIGAGFLLLWALLATTVTLIISIRILLGPMLTGWFQRDFSANKIAQKTRINPVNTSALAESVRTVDTTAAPESRPMANMNSAVKSCMWALSGIFCISFVTNLLMLTGPLFMLQIYDRVLTSRSIPTLTALLVLVAGLFFFLGVLELLRSRVLVRVGQRVDRQINATVFQSIVRATPSGAESRKFGLLQDLESVRQFFTTPAPAAAFDLPWTPLYFVVIFMFHWVLGVLAVTGAAILLLISLFNEYASKKSVASAGHFTTRSSAFAEAGRRNAEVLHAMGMFEAFQQRWLELHRTGVSHNLKAADVSGTMSVISKVTRLFLQSLMLAAGAYYAVAGEISPGVIVAASIILARALAPIEQIVGQWRNIISVRQSFGRLSHAMKELDQEDPRIALPEPQGFLSVEGVYAGPLGSREPVLKDLNFFLRPGDAVAVVGSNASGKSTLARVLVGVWPTLRGDVRLDGASLTQWLPQQLGSSVGYLPQDVELLEGTVAENIARFDPNATAEMIVQAAKKAHVHDLITRMPQGYGTKLGEAGHTISGGQRQRIAFARALYGNPALIVLDEPNANLDNEGELALTAAITALRQEERTVVVMAHRPNVLSAVNMVLVLKDGRQVSFGEKSETLKSNVTRANPRSENNGNAKPGTEIASAVRA